MSHSREPIEHTCPDIDRYIKNIKMVMITCSYSASYDREELFNFLCETIEELGDCIGYFEELRESNRVLRDWGVEEAEKVDELEDKIGELERLIEEMEIKK